MIFDIKKQQKQNSIIIEKWIIICTTICFTIFTCMTICILIIPIFINNDDNNNTLSSSSIFLFPSSLRKIQNHHYHRHHKKKKKNQREPPPLLLLYEPDPTIITVREEFEEIINIKDYDRLFNEEYKNNNNNIIRPHLSLQKQYDIYNCPIMPPINNYPIHYNVYDVIRHWNVDETNTPNDFIYQSICIFDWYKHQVHIQNYRIAEVPFIVQNQPDVLKTSYRWNQPYYMEKLLQHDSIQRVEYGHNTNHLMFWRIHQLTDPKYSNSDSNNNNNNYWKPPTENIELTYEQWYKYAKAIEEDNANTTNIPQNKQDHYYYRLNGALPDLNTFLYDELPIFQPSENDNYNIFMINSYEQRGINCRFGMKGNIAEMHFDPTRNWIIVLKGTRRYILSDISHCINMELYPKNHPSARHTSINWSTIINNNNSETTNDNNNKHRRPFDNAMIHEVILNAGDALYLPTSYMHMIISLNLNYQCNARSGHTTDHERHLINCGFLDEKT